MPSNLAPDFVNQAQLTQLRVYDDYEIHRSMRFNRISCLAKSQTKCNESRRTAANSGENWTFENENIIARPVGKTFPNPNHISEHMLADIWLGSDQKVINRFCIRNIQMDWDYFGSFGRRVTFELNGNERMLCLGEFNRFDIVPIVQARCRITLEFRSTSFHSVFCYAKITSFSVAVLTKNV